MSEDWLFCNRWRQIGGQIFISKRFALTHVGNYAFSEASQAELLTSLNTQLNAAEDLKNTTQSNGTAASNSSSDTTIQKQSADKSTTKTTRKEGGKRSKPTKPAVKTRGDSQSKGRSIHTP